MFPGNCGSSDLSPDAAEVLKAHSPSERLIVPKFQGTVAGPGLSACFCLVALRDCNNELTATATTATTTEMLPKWILIVCSLVTSLLHG